MNDFDDTHAPSPEFRASLEREIARAFRAERQFAPRPAARMRRLGMVVSLTMGAVVTLMIGLVLGTSTGYASAEVVSARQRAATATTMATTRELALARLDLARTKLALVRRSIEAGIATQTSIATAAAEVDSAEVSVALIESDLNANRVLSLSPRPALAMIPRRALTALTCGAVAVAPVVAPPPAQQGIPVVNLPSAAAKTAETIGAVFGLRQIEGGKVLVNDARRRQVKVFDSTLATSTIVIDSAPGGSNSYGRRPVALLPYVADSSLFPDLRARTMLVIDPRGQVVRALAMPTPRDVGSASDGAGLDNKGRLIYTGVRGGALVPGSGFRGYIMNDSIPVVRADLDLRQVDTIGYIARPLAKASGPTLVKGTTFTLFATDPLKTIDDFAVLSDGSVAFVRGQDYHIDWVRPDGAAIPSPKMPFDWKKLSDEDKQRIADSTRVAQNAALASGNVRGEMVQMARTRDPNAPPPEGGGAARGRAGGSGGGGAGREESGLEMDGRGYLPRASEVISPSQMPDYYPPIRVGTTLADLDGNLWILPTTSTQSQAGELVYDVVNAKGELFQRVRAPLGRLIVGFGRGGVVYMTSGDIANGFYLERTKLPPIAKTSSK